MIEDKHVSKSIDPIKFATQKMHWQGEVSLASMPRLAEACNTEVLVGSVTYDLLGDVDGQHIPYIEGHFKGTLPLVCQRCMAQFELNVDTQCKLSPVRSEEKAEALPSDYDVLMVGDNETGLIELIEDELLLCVPLVAMHEVGECEIKQENWSYGEDQKSSENEPTKLNPFAELAKLKKKD